MQSVIKGAEIFRKHGSKWSFPVAFLALIVSRASRTEEGGERMKNKLRERGEV